MKRDRTFLGTTERLGDFKFDEKVAEVFDDMLVRNVPYYLEQQFMVKEMGKKFWVPGTNIYDLGSSTGTTLVNLSRELDEGACLIGYDSSRPMIEKARQKLMENGLEHRVELRLGDLNKDLSSLSLENASVVTLCWTLQFILPELRDDLIRWIFDGLVSGGALVVTEKVITDDTELDELFVELYHDFKRRNLYSEEEIQRKREALEKVLIPQRIGDNLEMFRRNGFDAAETFFQWYNFAGFLCVKRQV